MKKRKYKSEARLKRKWKNWKIWLLTLAFPLLLLGGLASQQGQHETAHQQVSSESRPPPAVAAEEENSVEEDVTPTDEPEQSTENPASADKPAEDLPPTEVPQNLTNSIVVNGVVYPFQNGGQTYGQQIIDAGRYTMASTWGGAATLNVNDGLSTHLIGHNPGIFAFMFDLVIGDTITIYDSTGARRDYKVSEIVQVNDQGYEINTGADYWYAITEAGSREQIVLQTCITDTVNLIIFAH